MGGASFDFATARRAIGDGLEPFSISTDLHLHDIHGPVFDMATTLSKLLAVGLPLDSCITAVTAHPRSIIGLGGRDGLVPGTKADFTVFDLVDADLEVADSLGNKAVLSKIFEPRLTVLGNSAEKAERRLM